MNLFSRFRCSHWFLLLYFHQDSGFYNAHPSLPSSTSPPRTSTTFPQVKMQSPSPTPADLPQHEYERAVEHFGHLYNFTLEDYTLAMNPNYIRTYLERDAQVFAWLRSTGRNGWLLPLYHILATPNNVLIKLDFDDLTSIFERIAPPENMDDLTAMFSGMNF